jgi:ribA/ribD-fused uncharacterized protein
MNTSSQPRLDKIAFFAEEFHFLSNFHYSPFMYDGVCWYTAEHAYQAAKTEDPSEKFAIQRTKFPGAAKRMGKTVRVRSDWDDVKVGIMRNIVRAKFDQHEHLREMLVATEDLLIEEGNAWGDTFWGVCKGRGLNTLGNILMELREEYARSK